MDNSQSQQDYLKHSQQYKQQLQCDNDRKLQQSPVVISTTQTVLQELSKIYSQVLEKQKSLLNQLLNLQKLLNYTLSTQPLTQNQMKTQNNNLQKKVQQKKQQFNLQRIGQKIQQIIDQTDEVIVAVEEEVKMGDNNSEQQQQGGINAKSKNSYNNAISDRKNANTNYKKITILPQIKKQSSKQLTYKLQTMPDKKPPIPTVNRAIEGVNRVMNTVKYIPPRNKNEVTGKVTQTKIMTQDKVFRPDVTAKVGGGNISVGKGSSASHGVKISSVDEKRQPTSSSSTTVPTQNSLPSSTPSPSLTKQSFPPTQDINSISQYKNIRATTNKCIKLRQFRKQTQQLYQQYMSKKESVKKKYNFSKLLEKYQQQEMGHKGLQEKRRLNYIKKLNHMGLSMNMSTANDITHSIAKRVWRGYPHIFEFNQLLDRMQQQISKIEQQYKQDLRIDPKQVYRIQCGMKYIEREVGKIVASTEIEVPEKLELTFEAVSNREQGNNQQQQHRRSSQQSSLHSTTTTITLSPLYSQLLNLLEQTMQHQSLSTKDLSLLRVIVEIILFDCKKSPLIVKRDQLQQWRQFYQEVDGNEH